MPLNNSGLSLRDTADVQMVPVLTTEMFSRALWAGSTAVHRTRCPAKSPSCLSVRMGSGTVGSTARSPSRCSVCSCGALRHICVCHQTLTRGHFMSFTGYINCTLRFFYDIFMSAFSSASFALCPTFHKSKFLPSLSWSLKKKKIIFI